MAFRVERFPIPGGPVDCADAFEALREEFSGAPGFVCERFELGGKFGYAGAAPFARLEISGERLYKEQNGRRTALPGSPFKAVERELAKYRVSGAGAFSTAAFGCLHYEAVRFLEKLDLPKTDSDGALLLFDRLIVVSPNGRAELCAFGEGLKDAKRLASAVGRRLAGLKGKGAAVKKASSLFRWPEGRGGRARFLEGVRRLKRHIAQGDIFQAVLSESFEFPTKISALDFYRVLRRESPAPYLFCLIDKKRALVGSSPERLIRVVDGKAFNCPIAGTRPRGKDRNSDLKLERALRRSPKEKAEHLMLVDLARNDLGRVCAPGTVKVERLMEVRKFSNVMHLVSEVSGRLEGKTTAWQALAASFPAGTVSGAPKVRAMELIAEIERHSRGFYAGAVIHADFLGNLESAISIRTLELSGGRARLQAGAGIVADSRPEREYQEVLDKLAGLRAALESI
jgi:anthranilate synthase component 1